MHDGDDRFLLTGRKDRAIALHELCRPEVCACLHDYVFTDGLSKS